MNDLLKAFKIFAKYTATQFPTHCEHDVLRVCVSYDDVSDKDKKELDALGFSHDEENNMFMSYKYGSA